jgi:hypothetical protein
MLDEPVTKNATSVRPIYDDFGSREPLRHRRDDNGVNAEIVCATGYGDRVNSEDSATLIVC